MTTQCPIAIDVPCKRLVTKPLIKYVTYNFKLHETPKALISFCKSL